MRCCLPKEALCEKQPTFPVAFSFPSFCPAPLCSIMRRALAGLAVIVFIAVVTLFVVGALALRIRRLERRCRESKAKSTGALRGHVTPGECRKI